MIRGILTHFGIIIVSLFHYRNDGGDVAKVLVGLQIPPSKSSDLESFLSRLKYPCTEETENPLVFTLL